jgi:hypothetical protein
MPPHSQEVGVCDVAPSQGGGYLGPEDPLKSLLRQRHTKVGLHRKSPFVQPY